MEEGDRRLERKRFGNTTRQALKTMKGATSQGMQVASEGEKQRSGCSQQLPERMKPY